MITSLFKFLKTIKFTQNLMPIYCFQNPKISDEKLTKKLVKFVDVIIRLEESKNDTEESKVVQDDDSTIK